MTQPSQPKSLEQEIEYFLFNEGCEGDIQNLSKSLADLFRQHSQPSGVWVKASEQNKPPFPGHRNTIHIKYNGRPDVLLDLHGAWYFVSRERGDDYADPVAKFQWEKIEYWDESKTASAEIERFEKVNANLKYVRDEYNKLNNRLAEDLRTANAQISEQQQEIGRLKEKLHQYIVRASEAESQLQQRSEPKEQSEAEPLKDKSGQVITCCECKKRPATYDYNGHFHFVCESCFDSLCREFEDEYK
jgi:DNA repair exonuclease SbcCD ATPase subunit